MKNKNLAYVIIAICALVITTLACGSSNSGSKVGSSTPGSSSNSGSSAPTIYAVGDVVAIDDQTIVLNKVTVTGNTLKANFTVENKGSSDLNISSLLSFSAKDSEGTKLDQDFMDCGDSFGGKVLPGDKLKGDICWKGLTTDTAKIYYEASILSSGAIVWQISK